MRSVPITSEEIFELHAEGIQRYGGQPSIRSDTEDCVNGRIGNAALAENYVADEERVRVGLCFAGFLLFYLAKDSCFVDGNKRVAWMAAMRVLAAEGLTLEVSEDEAYEFMDSVSTGKIKRGQHVVRWLADRLVAPED